MTSPSSTAADFKLLISDRLILLSIIVSALGYFVDIFDLLLFSIVRIQSLKDLGVPEESVLDIGVQLINWQMAGLLIGGFFWGILGDKIGRVRVLFASILLYSLANIANGFVQTVDQYAALRFIGGVGLAGELGLGVTLVSELLPKSVRGWGTAIIAGIGTSGAIFAALIADMTDWRTAYIIGGVMGLALLLLRFKLRDAGIFAKTKHSAISRGSLTTLFGEWRLIKKYAQVVLTGAPIWATIGIFITFTPEFAKAFGMSVTPTAGMAVLASYAGLAVGDILSGFISQYWRSRRKCVVAYLCFLTVAAALFINVRTESLPLYYTLCFLLGLGAGYWAMFVQMGAEKFGTNIRATAATSIPCIVRGMVIPMTMGFHALIAPFGIIGAGVTVMGIVLILAFISIWRTGETFDIDLDYIDGNSQKGNV